MQKDVIFVIPTYRLRDVGDTVEQYDDHFFRNGHSVRMIVFDDSTPSTQEKYYPLLEQTRTHNDVFYVGPKEKERFLSHLNQRLRDKRLEGLVRNLFRPSYGGNRNYTLDSLMISADDEMRPYALMQNRHETLQEHEVCRGKLSRSGEKNTYMRNPLTAEIFNEEVANLLKKKIKASLTRLDDLSISFDYDGSVSAEDAQEILEKTSAVCLRAERAAKEAVSPERAAALELFAANMRKSFYGFEPDFFQQNLLQIVDDVLTVIKGSMELWPTLIEIAFLEKARHGLPELRVAHQRR